MKKKSSIANSITLSRIAASLCLLPFEVATWAVSPFWLLYAFSGATDMVDGYVARRLKAETKAGASLDSIADIVFVICSSCKILPVLTLPSWLWRMALVVVAIKLANQISAWVVHKRFLFPHTIANKITGLMLFVSIPICVCFEIFLSLAITAAVAMCAAIQEGYYICTRHQNVP